MLLQFQLNGMSTLELSVAFILSPTNDYSAGLSPPMISIRAESVPDHPSQFAVELIVHIAPLGDAAVGYRIVSHTLAGCSIIGDGGAPAETRRLAAINSATILYGALRGQLAGMTGNFPGGVLLLPAVYMAEIWRQQEESIPSEAAESVVSARKPKSRKKPSKSARKK